MKITIGLASIIIPTHNRVEELNQALNSVLNQSYQPLEIIVIADNCQDHTRTFIKQRQKEHKQQPIIFIESKQAIGAAKARNLAIDRASGEYIAFLDDDDIWHQHKLESQIKILNSQQYAIVGTNHICVYGPTNKSIKLSKSKSKSIITIDNMYDENLLGSFSFCITKQEYIGEHRINEQLKALQDWDLWLKILHHTKLPAYINQQHHVHYRYKIHSKSISNNIPNLITAQKIFLNAWQAKLGTANINYHKMRTANLQLRLDKASKNYIYQLALTLKTIFTSRQRYNIKRYIQYSLTPLFNLRTAKLWILKKCTLRSEKN